MIADTDDPKVAGFMDNIGRLNGLAKRMPGFVWMMESDSASEGGNTDVKINGDPRFITNLSVWEGIESLEQYVWGTVHRQFYERKENWFEAMGDMHFVMWWIPEGHRPNLEEAMDKLKHRQIHGDSDDAFGWEFLSEANLWRQHKCS